MTSLIRAKLVEAYMADLALYYLGDDPLRFYRMIEGRTQPSEYDAPSNRQLGSALLWKQHVVSFIAAGNVPDGQAACDLEALFTYNALRTPQPSIPASPPELKQPARGRHD